jgi:hypothetical protein
VYFYLFLCELLTLSLGYFHKLLSDVIKVLIVFKVEFGLTGMSAHQHQHIVEEEVTHLVMHGELHHFNPILT